MKKVLYLITVLLISFKVANVYAATGSVTAYTPVSNAVVGSTFTVTVTVSSDEALGTWQYGLTYDSNYISLVTSESSSTTIADFGNGSDTVRYYNYKFVAIASGTAWINITGASMVSWNDDATIFTPSISGDYVVVQTQAEIEASYSSDNNLNGLSITGYELTPAFDMNTLEYSVEVPDDVTSIEVNASLNDWTARVSGVGSVDVSPGKNKVQVVVTAQNGASKTYVINVTVKDLNPIDVTVNGKKYSVVKKESLLECPTGFNADKIKIDKVEVPVFKSKVLGLTLIGLKDDSGKINLFIYDEAKKTYSIYNEVKSASLTLFPMEASSIPDGFTKSKITINKVEYPAYVSNISSDYVIVYAKSIDDGKEDFYTYDKSTNSFIKYNSTFYEAAFNKNEEYKLYMLGLIVLSVILFLISIIEARKNSKMKKAIKKVINNNQEEIQEQNTSEEVKEEVVENTETNEIEDENIIDLDDKPKKKKKKKNKQKS